MRACDIDTVLLPDRVFQVVGADIDRNDGFLGAHGYILGVDGNDAEVCIESMEHTGWFPLASLEVLV